MNCLGYPLLRILNLRQTLDTQSGENSPVLPQSKAILAYLISGKMSSMYPTVFPDWKVQ